MINAKVKTYLIVFCVISLSVLAWGGCRYQLYRTLKNNMYEKTLATDRTIVELGVNYVSNNQNMMLDALSAIAANGALRQALLTGDKNEIGLMLDALALSVKCEKLIVLDESGKDILHRFVDETSKDAVGTICQPPPETDSFVRPAWFVTGKNMPGDGAPMIVFCSPIRDDEYRPAGTLVAYQGPVQWRELLIGMTHLQKDFSFYLIDGKKVVAQSHPDLKMSMLIGRLVGEASESMGPHASGYNELIWDIDHISPFFLSTARDPQSGWTLALAHDYEKVMAPMEAMLRNITIFMSLLLILLGGVGAAIYRRYEEKKKTLDHAGGEVMRLENEIRSRTEDLRISTERYTKLIRGLPDVIFETNPDGRITFVSASIIEILGFMPEDLNDRSWSDYVHPDDLAAYLKAWDQSADEADFAVPALRHLNSQANIRYLTLYFIPLFGAAGSLIGWNGVARDVTREIRTSHRVKELTRQLIQGQEEERRRLALDLHDEMGQVLSALKIGLQSLVEDGNARENANRAEIDQLIELTQTIMDRIRSLSYSLHPAILDNFGLSAAIEDLCESRADAEGVEINFNSADIGEPGLSRELKTTLFRFVQEGLTNAVKHSYSSKIDVDLELSGDKLVITVKDYGRGFDVEKTLARSAVEKKLGLWGMTERLGLAGGQLTIESGPNGSTLIAEVLLE